MSEEWHSVTLKGDRTDRLEPGWQMATIEWKVAAPQGWLTFYGGRGGRIHTQRLTASEARFLGDALLNLAAAIEAPRDPGE